MFQINYHWHHLERLGVGEGEWYACMEAAIEIEASKGLPSFIRLISASESR